MEKEFSKDSDHTEQKVVIKVYMSCPKSRSRALKIAVGASVLESVGAAAASGGDGDKKKEEDKGKENEAKMQMVWPPFHASLPLYYHDSCGSSFI
ncbi:hypothetical protein Q3G72_029710 [Acer saccharum]|nr:hypothetical protein Q3G72_029710 [Acer saccharum]